LKINNRETKGSYEPIFYLEGADLREANLEGFNLEEANLRGANLKHRFSSSVYVP